MINSDLSEFAVISEKLKNIFQLFKIQVGSKNTHIANGKLKKINQIKETDDRHVTVNENDITIKINGHSNKDIDLDDNEENENVSVLIEDDGKTNLHGYNQISPGCGKKIQLEDPNKKEMLVRNCLNGDGNNL